MLSSCYINNEHISDTNNLDFCKVQFTIAVVVLSESAEKNRILSLSTSRQKLPATKY